MDMKKQIHKISIVTSLLWAAAIIAAAIVKAPTFFTVLLLPMLAFSSLTAIETIGRRSLSVNCV
jgi:hypothetical protein